MRILLTTDTVGGVWSYALELAAGLRSRGVEVALATMGRALSEAQLGEAAAISGLQVHESSYRLEWMHDPWDDLERAGDWLLSLERELRPDVVHLNGLVHGDLPWRAPVLLVAHSCVLSWWHAVRGEAAPAEWERYRREVTRSLRAVRLVAAPTAAMLRCVERYYGPLREGTVIPNGREPSRYVPLPKEPFVLSAGRIWDEAKNTAALAAVAPELSWPVYVAGEDRHPDGGQAAHNGVRPLGRLETSELARWFGRASIYALPARYEPFGLSALEAALAGCALVLGDIPSLREVWEDDALFVPPGDHAALRAALQSLIDDPGTRSRLAHRARRRAFRYTSDRMAGHYLNLYATLRGSYAGSEPRSREADEVEELEKELEQLECVS